MKPETVITALQDVAAQQYAENSQHVTGKLSAFTAARDTHAASMQVLKKRLIRPLNAVSRSGRPPLMRAQRRSRTGAAAFAPCAAVSPLKWLSTAGVSPVASWPTSSPA